MVTPPPVEFPQTPAELFEHLQSLFGLGDYDEATSKLPYWRWRNIEISKLKAMMKRRHLSERDFAIAAWHAQNEQTAITAAWQLSEIVGDALRAHRRALRAVPTDVRTRLNEAAQEAAAQDEPEWAARLFNADDASGEAVLTQWSNR